MAHSMVRAFLILIIAIQQLPSGFAQHTIPSQYTQDSIQYQSEHLIVKQISNKTYLHTSYLQTKDFGKVACNGMIVISQGEAVIFDTPANDTATKELLALLSRQLPVKIKAVVSTHFHADCLAGLAAFHSAGIPSFANKRTINLMKTKKSNFPIPQKAFNRKLDLRLGNKTVNITFPGEGHTRDNVIAYFPSDQVLFGGCLIKASGATKGNLEDANVTTWANTVKKVMKRYPKANTVIPGHGQVGGKELLEYTIKLFEDVQ